MDIHVNEAEIESLTDKIFSSDSDPRFRKWLLASIMVDILLYLIMFKD